MDPARATVYEQTSRFKTEHGEYTNLIYRAHFERSPFSVHPVNVSVGHNVGLMAIVTLDAQERPVLATTVHTCGCYHAIIPTSYLSKAAYPLDWNSEHQKVYGETLPGLLTYPAESGPADAPRVVIHFRDGTHRVKDVQLMRAADIEKQFTVDHAVAAPMASLEQLPLGNGKTTSYYYTQGRRKGLVKGALKPMETALFGLWVGDAHVGQDRKYGPQQDTGKLFYTTLNRFEKRASDMSNYGAFLRLNKWRIE